MPGIFVRTIGQVHWDEQRKEPVLTIPGSYWLCHKNKIYKFTLKFHKSIRNTIDFPYSKDLMRVIRRILKCNPQHGQQFCTKHLLVIYNETAWTRTDKMFAVMKFQDRPDATVFSYAFVLTVKIISMSEIETNSSDDQRSTTYTSPRTRSDRHSERGKSYVNDTEVESQFVISIAERGEPKDTSNRKTDENSANRETKPDRLLKSSENTSIEEDDASTEFYKSPEHSTVCEMNLEVKTNSDERKISREQISVTSKEVCETSNCNDSQGQDNLPRDCTKVDGNDCCFVKCNASETSKNQTNYEKKEESIEKQNETVQERNSFCLRTMEVDDDVEVDVDGETEEISDVSITLSVDDDETEEVNEEMEVETGEIESTVCEKSDKVIEKNSVVKTSYGEDEENNDVQIDSTCLPYQYLIERDIVNSMNNAMERKSTVSKSPEKESPAALNEEKNGTVAKSQREIMELHSLDITDLVMKGLMFTIRQEQDSVTVVKQRTKVELDEVLENSEKVETKEGDPCLMNSSLLKLESMITKIEGPALLEPKREKIKVYDHTPSNSPLKNERHDFYTEFSDVDEASNERILRKVLSKQNKSFSSEQTFSSFAESPALSPLNKTNYGTQVEEEMTKNYLTDEEDEVEVDIENEEEEDDDEDIVPEAFQSISSKSQIFDSTVEDLLMDDFEDDISIQKRKSAIVNNKLQDPGDSILDKVNLQQEQGQHSKSNIPKVISDQIIKSDQLPLGLLKVLKNKPDQNKQSSCVLNKNPEVTADAIKIFPNDNIASESDNMCIDLKTEQVEPMEIDHSMTEHKQDKEEGETVDIERVEPVPMKNIDLKESIVESKTSCTSITERSEELYNNVSEEKIEDSAPNSVPQTVIRTRRRNPARKQKETSLPVSPKSSKQIASQQKSKNFVNISRERRQRKTSAMFDKYYEKKDIHIEMWKLIQDITRGVKVVVERISTKDLHS